MGNHQTSSKKSKSSSPSIRKKTTSSTAEQTAVDGDVTSNPYLEVNIYKSYSGNGTASPASKRHQQTSPDIRVYRRSARPLSNAALLNSSAASRSMSLPRSFGGRVHRGGVQQQFDNNNISTLPRHQRSTVAASAGDNDNNVTVVRSSRSSCNVVSQQLSTSHRVTSEDFPPFEFVNRRLKYFEKSFVTNILKLFSTLPLDVRLSSLVLAVHTSSSSSNQHQQSAGHDDDDNDDDRRLKRVVTLGEFLKTSNEDETKKENDENQTIINDEFLTQCASGLNDFVACVSPALFPGIAQARISKVCDESLLTSLCNDVMVLIAAESASELSRILEYQVTLLIGGAETASSVALLAEHCAERAIDYAIRVCRRQIDCNTLTRGSFRGRPTKQTTQFYVSAVIGLKELKWNVSEIISRPALRRDRLLTDAILDDDVSPWQYMTSSHCDPQLYGYRGVLVDWDFVSSKYVVNRQDEMSFSEEMSNRSDDFHQLYTPYRCLIGAKAMHRYLLSTDAESAVHLNEYLMKIAGNAGYDYKERKLLPVYRPLELIAMERQVNVSNIGQVEAPYQLLKSLLRDSSTAMMNVITVSHVQQTGV